MTRCLIVTPFFIGLLISTAIGPGFSPINAWSILCTLGILWQAIPGVIVALRLAVELLEYTTRVDFRSYRLPS